MFGSAMNRIALLVVAACHSASVGMHDDASVADTLVPIDGTSSSKCPIGSTLLVDRTSCTGAVVAPPSSLATGAAQPGTVVGLDGLDSDSVPCLATYVCSPDDAPAMLFSDDPESPATDGVLYADTFGPGAARIYVYHVNAGAAARKFPVVVLNSSAVDAHVTIRKVGLATPSTDYIGVGKSVAAAWMSSSLSRVVTVPAGTRILLDSDLDDEHAATNELVHAIIDLDADAPLKFSVVSVAANEDAAAITAGLSLLPFDGHHDRGTFVGADVWMVASAGGEGPSARKLSLGANTTEPDLTGRDATTGAPATLTGNYGVAYRFVVTAPNSIRFGANPRGGDWAGVVDNEDSVVTLPSTSGAVTTNDLVWLASAGDFSMMSGGGSSLPIDVLVLTP
jgi:hypothetical protein